MLHHLPDDLKLQGLSEIRRVLRPGGRLVVCDFLGSDANQEDQTELLRSATFTSVESEELRFPRTHRRWSGAIFVVGTK